MHVPHLLRRIPLPTYTGTTRHRDRSPAADAERARLAQAAEEARQRAARERAARPATVRPAVA